MVLKDQILAPVLNFAFPKLQSQDWTERLSGSLALQAVIEGPDANNFAMMINEHFKFLISLINEPVPKVKKAVAYVFFRLSQYSQYLILCNPEYTTDFINACLEHINTSGAEITVLLAQSIANLFEFAARSNVEHLLTQHFVNCVQTFMQVFNREDVVSTGN